MAGKKTRVALIALLALGLAFGVAVLAVEDLRKLDFLRLASRAGWQRPAGIIDALAIEPGDRVVDLGAGSGYFVGYLSRAVGPLGRVYAVEVSQSALAGLEDRVREAGLANVEVIEGSATDPNLPDGSIDLVFLCDVYHHIGGRVEYFDRLRTDLAGSGRVAIVEPRARGLGRLLTPHGHSTPVGELIGEMRRAGYGVEASFDFLPFQNLMIFRPLADAAGESP